jgi:hypothetical protein
METRNAFKTIVFFGITDEKSFSLKHSLAHLPFIKVFQTTTIDEIKQIIDMSSKTAIVTDNLVALEKIKETVFSDGKDKARKYYFDWEMEMDQATSTLLGINKITILKTQKIPEAVERLELYLFGKVNIFSKGNYNPTKVDAEEGNKFFTLLERIDGNWKVVASSHEKEDDISMVLGKDWNQFLGQTVQQVEAIKQPSEVKLSLKPFYEIIYPHFQNDIIHKLSIIHLSIDAHSEEDLTKIRSFLQNI